VSTTDKYIRHIVKTIETAFADEPDEDARRELLLDVVTETWHNGREEGYEDGHADAQFDAQDSDEYDNGFEAGKQAGLDEAREGWGR
jgi:hypothetical protein